jgi:hypothetical protein
MSLAAGRATSFILEVIDFRLKFSLVGATPLGSIQLSQLGLSLLDLTFKRLGTVSGVAMWVIPTSVIRR